MLSVPVKMGPLKSWLLLKRPHVIAIRDISPYIFCQNYHPNTTDPRQSKFQQLELEFTHAQGKIHDDESALGSEWNYVDHRL